MRAVPQGSGTSGAPDKNSPDVRARVPRRGLPALLRDALRHADGGDAARLRAHDAAGAARAALDSVVQQELRHLWRAPEAPAPRSV